MADRRRTLNIPIYDVKDAPGGIAVDDDVIDVETIDLDPSFAERLRGFAQHGAEAVSEAVRNVKLNGARDAFFTQRIDDARTAFGSADSRTRARQEGREQRREQARLRDAQASDSRQNQRDRINLEREARVDPLARLKLNTLLAGETYMDSLRRSGILDAGQSKDSQRKQLSGLHQIYASMMVLQCVRPLQQGLSGQNVVSSLGMAASMWMMSPDFRTQVGTFTEQIGAAIRAKIDGRGEKKDATAQRKFDKLTARGRGDLLAERWQKRLDRIEYAERGHRLPFTSQSAAMTEVALAEAAYADMRLPGTDPRVIQERYETALGALYEYVDDDGIDREDVSRSMRVIVGQRLEKDPALASVFGELGHGRFAKSEPREVYVNGTTEKMNVWTGDFVDSYEGRTISTGSFRLRPIMTLDEHRVLSAETLAAELSSATTAAEMNDALSQFVVAAAVSEYPGVIDEIEDPASRRRFGKVRTMFASMSADGLNADEQHFAYSAAFVDAVEVAQIVRPDLGAEWMAKYGDNWRERVAEDIRRYKDMGAKAEHEKHGPSEDERYFHAERSAHEGDTFTAEDIVDADVVDDEPTTRAPRRPGRAHRPSQPSNERRSAPRAIDEPVYEGELVEENTEDTDEVLDLDADELDELAPGQARRAILSGATSTAEPEVDPGRSTAAKVRRARVNQHYNEVETGGITGIGRDDAAPLQDVDFQLG